MKRRYVWLLVPLVVVVLLYANLNTVGPVLADWGRAILGPEVVASAETVLFRFEDWWAQTTYNEEANAGPQWAVTPVAVVTTPHATPTHAASATSVAKPTSSATATAAPTETPLPTATPAPSLTATAEVVATNAPTMPSATDVPSATLTPSATNTPLPLPTDTPLPLPTNTPLPLPIPPVPAPSGVFPPAALNPYLAPPSDGEGVWVPLAVSGAGGADSPLHYTFWRPDPNRPYAYVALVAVDLSRVRLGLVNGTIEPASAVAGSRPGVIPDADRVAGRLLATFNGGFKAGNGGFGIMTDGTEWLSPLQYHGTIVLHDGQVSMGDWGVDFNQFPAGTSAWRQAPPLLVNNGRMHPELSGSNAVWWGTTVDNDVVTWRSGVGISADGQTLYYGVGPALSAEAVARAFLAAGASEAAELDINGPYVRFLTYNDALTPQKLLADMVSNSQQYIAADERDFFYLVWR